MDFASDMALGAKPDGYAMKWWLKQSSEARAELVNDEALPIGRALSQLCQFIKDNQQPAGKKHLCVWGNDASFDCVILRAAYAHVGITPPWDWWRDLDVRTVVEMGRGLGYDQKYNLIFKGVQHTALDDALHQAAYVSEIWQRLTADKEPIL